MQARFVSGDPIMIPFTPASDVAAGDIIVKGAKCYIAHLPITANTLGAVAAQGGIYEVLATGGSGGDVIAMGDKVYWNDSGNVGEEDSSGQNPLGWAIQDKAETEDTIFIEHGAW